MGSHHLVPRGFAIKMGAFHLLAPLNFQNLSVCARSVTVVVRTETRILNTYLVTSTAAILEMARLLQTHQGVH